MKRVLTVVKVIEYCCWVDRARLADSAGRGVSSLVTNQQDSYHTRVLYTLVGVIFWEQSPIPIHVLLAFAAADAT